MIPLAIFLISIGLGDIVAGYSGGTASWQRVRAGVITATVSAIALGASAGYSALQVLLLGCFIAVAGGFWLSTRRIDLSATTAGLVAATWWIVLIVILLTLHLWPEPQGALVQIINRHPMLRTLSLSGNQWFLLMGIAVFYQASCNALVRLVLQAAGTRDEETESHLQGGRIIGPLERVLLFGFAAVGEPAAAAVVVAAKGFLRYPEITSKADESGALAEYVLVGSLSSWVFGLAPVLLFLVAR